MQSRDMDVTVDFYVSDVNTTSLPDVDADEILWKLNSDKVIVLLPVIIYIIVCVIMGIVGNTIVCYIYTSRLRRSPSRIYILFLALLDLMTCIVGAASELTDLFQPFVFTATYSCKILRFGLSFTIICATFTLTCVAFDRYYKVCRPLNAFPMRKVKTLCIVVASMSLVLSSPALALFGLKTVETGIAGVTGSECSTTDSVRHTALPVAYYIILFMAFIVLLACFVLLYIRIGLEIWKRKRLTIGETLPTIYTKETSGVKCTKYARATSVLSDDTSKSSYHTEDCSESQGGGIDNQIVEETDSCLSAFNKNGTLTNLGSANTGTLPPVGPVRLRRRKSNLGRMSIRTLRTTGIFFAVSLTFVLSFLPYLIANVLKFTRVAFHDIDTDTEEVVYNFCVRSYFISNFVNPIIYSALNINFRREVKKLLKRMLAKLKLCCMCSKQ